MIETLLARAPTRFLFVVGKGGVGKTTTAGALALALADRKRTTRLISTDPAHSLADLFNSESCSEYLAIEEFDARAYADKFFAELRAPFIELIERGTYLDEADAAGFLDLSIPGIDEVMGALRLVELHESDTEYVVVDTAPTGHTLRLLETGDIIDSWVGAGRAMAEKASVVSAALVGQPVPLSAVPLLDDWKSAAAQFESKVVRDSSAFVITRAGEVVGAETRRLILELEKHGMAVAATIAVGDAAADFTVDWLNDATGCDGLREWRDHIRETGDAPTPAPVPAPTPDRERAGGAADWLRGLESRMIWVTGKGGVGKSTVAAAIGVAIAEKRSVCVVSTDPAGSLSEVFGVEVSAEARLVAPNLFARQIDATAEFQRMRERFRESVNDVFEDLGLQQAAALDRRVIESLWDFAPPGIDEIISLLEILDDADDFDTLIVDSAPTGHFLRLIQMPDIALDWVRALMRLLVKYGTAGSLDALAQDLLAFAKRLKQLKSDLSAPATTAVFIVTLDEPMVHAETTRLSAALATAGVNVTATILNRDDGDAAHATNAQIHAPEFHQEVVGPDTLRSFLAQWDMHGD